MYGDRDIEATEAALDGAKARTVAAIRSRVTAPGREDCADCGEPIPPARRAAMPSAERCVGCQSKLERGHA